MPNFVVVGAGKAGTTSLHRYLAQHPQIYMSPVKEPCFFASEIRPDRLTAPIQRHVELQSRALPQIIHDGKPFQTLGWIASDWEEYLRLFQEVRGETAIGESSAAYLWSETAAANIRQRIPHARIVMILRDPAERAFSHYLHQLSVGLTGASFREHLELCARGDHKKLGVLYPFLEVGLYSQQVQRFLAAFPREQIRIYWYEQDWPQPARLMADLYAFLGVDAGFPTDTSQRSLERRAPALEGCALLPKTAAILVPLEAADSQAAGARFEAGGFPPGKIAGDGAGRPPVFGGLLPGGYREACSTAQPGFERLAAMKHGATTGSGANRGGGPRPNCR